MPSRVAAVVFALGILGLFALDRDRISRTSKALWIPVIWLLINASRPVSSWLQMEPILESPDQYLEGSFIDRLVYICLLVAGLVVLASRRRRVGSFLRANGPILLFFGYCAVSTLWSDYSGVAFKRWIKALGDLVMVLIVLTDVQPAAAVKRLMARVGYLLLPMSILFIRYYPDLGRGYDRWSGTPVLVGVTNNKNILGLVALIWGVGAAWRFLIELRSEDQQRSLRHLIAQGALLAMALWLLAKAHSATSLACFFLACTLLAVTSLFAAGRKPAVVHILVLGAVSGPVFAIFANPGGGAIQALGRDPTLTGRSEIWHLVLGMTVNPIFGAGFESFWLGERLKKVWDIYSFHLNEAHNGYIELYLNLGWIGIALLAVVFIRGYRNAVAVFRRDPGAGRFKLAFIVIAAVYSLTEAGFRMLNPVWIFFLLAASADPEVPHLQPPTSYLGHRVNDFDSFRPENVSATISSIPMLGSSELIAASVSRSPDVSKPPH